MGIRTPNRLAETLIAAIIAARKHIEASNAARDATGAAAPAKDAASPAAAPPKKQGEASTLSLAEKLNRSTHTKMPNVRNETCAQIALTRLAAVVLA